MNRGEKHNQAKHSDHEVRLMRELREKYGLTHREIAEKFECAERTVCDICNYTRRAIA